MNQRILFKRISEKPSYSSPSQFDISHKVVNILSDFKTVSDILKKISNKCRYSISLKSLKSLVWWGGVVVWARRVFGWRDENSVSKVFLYFDFFLTFA